MPGLLRKNQKIPAVFARFWILEHIFFVLSTKVQKIFKKMCLKFEHFVNIK
ncbi:hypothetical protein AB434_2949 [Heyndrickxia coagulans]|uniref:Uncharacterized protein n=1 Tax=Heyndrickxia coagulans TaxID=1398 RepID=A0AAN0T7P2_HEYCO|nr:hypothetical protein SB48_HM08orf03705 [Heyndrickxia coagulans]AKN55354.1 hypothetical protein AB434_2949 [Heyndrickxia coagulans]